MSKNVKRKSINGRNYKLQKRQNNECKTKHDKNVN